MESLGVLLHNAAQQLKRAFEREARPHGLTMLQWRVLGTLAREDGQSQKSLASRLEVSAMSISDVLERLETAGLIRREVDPVDSRAKIVRITPAGEQQVEAMRDISARIYASALDGIAAEDRDAMLRGLSRVAANLDGSDDPAKDDER